MAHDSNEPVTFVELVLKLLEDRFPWLSSVKDESVSGADTVSQLSELHEELTEKREESGKAPQSLPNK